MQIWDRRTGPVFTMVTKSGTICSQYFVLSFVYIFTVPACDLKSNVYLLITCIRDNSHKPGGFTRSWIVYFKSPHYFKFNEERKKKKREEMPAEIRMSLFFNCIREKK